MTTLPITGDAVIERGIDVVNESTRILREHNDRYCRHGVEFWCNDCNRRANVERVNAIIRERRPK